MNHHDDIQYLKILYFQANRCWRSNNLKACLLICNILTNRLNELINSRRNLTYEVNQIKHLVWFLKIKCLADDYYVNESLLLNEDDIDDEDQVRVFSGTRQSRLGTSNRVGVATTTHHQTGEARKITTAGGVIEASRHRTAGGGILTGRMPSVSSRQSSRATTSYRPLTTSLTATQTAFSRSTRPLLKYSTCYLLSKMLFVYLYNAQSVSNKCPDYRQCLEYLNVVQNALRKRNSQSDTTEILKTNPNKGSLLVLTDQVNDERKKLGAFWLNCFGSCYYNLHMNKQAEEYFQQSISVNPKNLDSYAWLVKIYLRYNQPIKILKTCENGLKHSRNALLFNWMARVQSLIGDLYAANLSLRDSLNYYPTNLEALANVGYFAFYGDKLEQSLKCFQRIQQLSANQSTCLTRDINIVGGGSTAELFNNLALCNFYCGFYQKVMPLFNKAFLSSPSKQVTSDIWYNVSFLPLSCGFKNLAIACLRLALKNNSQNEEALNNLGVLKYECLINHTTHYKNRQELWSSNQQKQQHNTENELKNLNNHDEYQIIYDEAETYFRPLIETSSTNDSSGNVDDSIGCQPEMLYNMAIIKRRRGQLLASVKYCNLYLDYDQNNYHVRNILQEISQIVSHDG